MTVINKAKALRARHSHILGGPDSQNPTTQQLVQRVDGLVDEGRFSAAAVVVGQIVAKIRGAPNPPLRFRWTLFGNTYSVFIPTPTSMISCQPQLTTPWGWS